MTEKPEYYTKNAKGEFVEVQDKQEMSDGYHTFAELYSHRCDLFAFICNNNKHAAWKSLNHSIEDSDMYEDYFIVGIETLEGQYTYHYHIREWDKFDVPELYRAPKWDGHKPSDITRLNSGVFDLLNLKPYDMEKRILNFLEEIYINKLVNSEFNHTEAIKEFERDTRQCGISNIEILTESKTRVNNSISYSKLAFVLDGKPQVITLDPNRTKC